MLAPGITVHAHLPALLRRRDLYARPLGWRDAAGVSGLPLLKLLAHVAEAHTVVLDAELLVQHLALRAWRNGKGLRTNIIRQVWCYARRHCFLLLLQPQCLAHDSRCPGMRGLQGVVDKRAAHAQQRTCINASCECRAASVCTALVPAASRAASAPAALLSAPLSLSCSSCTGANSKLTKHSRLLTRCPWSIPLRGDNPKTAMVLS